MQHSPNIIQRLAEDFTLSDKNADADNWTWKARTGWNPAEENWQHFCTKWYGASESQSAPLVDPKFPSMSLEPLPPRLDPDIASSIFVRNSYVTMFDTVWAQAIKTRGRHGVIITGQPGTGKTLFNYYLLVRLLKRKQVVLFSPEGKTVYLFYHNEVYAASMEVLANQGLDVSLPEPTSPDIFIWSLFDIREQTPPEMFLVTLPCLPVQTASPDPIGYKTWKKERRPLLAGLPLWTRDELAQALKCQDEYRSLLDTLDEVYRSSSPDLSDPLDVYPGARALLDERYSEEDTVPPSPEDALDYLLGAAIDRFGYSARDVFGAVFDYLGMTQNHEDAFDLNFTELQDTVSSLSKNQSSSHSISHWILALSPVDQGPLMHVGWNVDFKSDWVARNVMQALGEAEDIIIQQQIRFF